MATITSPYYADLGKSYLHSTGHTIEPRTNVDGRSVFVILSPEGAPLINADTCKVLASTTAVGAMKILDEALARQGHTHEH